jgi:hypothetical protein
MNHVALRTIEEVSSPSPISYNSLSLIQSWWTRGAAATVFTESVNLIDHEMQRLILSTTTLFGRLDTLKEHLKTLHLKIILENSSVSAARTDLLANLWTALGGNKRQLHALEARIELLRDLAQFHQRALVHVGGALLELRVMSADMDNLRERVTAATLTSGTIPLEVHVQSMLAGLERLQKRRIMVGAAGY